jgi:hypothetical protein
VAPAGLFVRMANASAGLRAISLQVRRRRWLDAELAGEAELMALGDVGLSARARVIRETDPKVWAFRPAD